MRIIVSESPIGELFFSLPQSEELIIAEEQIINHCRNALKQKENSRLEYELEQMKKTKTAFHFLMLKEIYLLSREKGHPIILHGNIAGSIISYLLGISPINPDEVPFIAPELIWEADTDFDMPDFEIGICADIRPLIQKRLDKEFGFVNTNDTLYYRIVMADSPLCNEVSNNDINIKNFDMNVCTAVLKELYPEQENNSCKFEQLINCYAYIVGGFANDIPLEDLLNDNVIVTRDNLYLSLTANNVPHELAAEIVKKGIWSGESQKREYLLQLEKYSLPESVIFSINNAENLWNTAACVSRLCLRCQKEYELRRKSCKMNKTMIDHYGEDFIVFSKELCENKYLEFFADNDAKYMYSDGKTQPYYIGTANDFLDFFCEKYYMLYYVFALSDSPVKEEVDRAYEKNDYILQGNVLPNKETIDELTLIDVVVILALISDLEQLNTGYIEWCGRRGFIANLLARLKNILEENV